MKLRYIALLLVCVASITGYGRTAADFFLDMPNKHLPLLDRNTRMDMLDYFNAGLETSSRTGVGGEARILSSHPRRMLVQVSRDATVEIALVTSGSDTIVALIETVKTPIPDSFVTLMNKDFSHPGAIAMPDAAMMAGKENAKAMKKQESPSMVFISATFDPDNDAFVFTNNTSDYFHPSETPESVRLMRPQIHAVVKGGKFVEIKH